MHHHNGPDVEFRWRNPFEIFATYPEIHDRVVRVHDSLNASTTTACEHIRQGAVPVICAEHPAVGLLCADCMSRHCASHAPDDEFTCNRCGRMRVHLHAFQIGVLLFAVLSRTVHGYGGTYSGPAVVTCLGVCEDCYQGAEP